MPRPFKVWGGLSTCRNRMRANGSFQARTIIKARTKKRALDILRLIDQCRWSREYFDNHWCETGNKHELDLASSRPDEGAWVNQGEDYDNRFYVQHYPTLK